jgi:hypothetical protein
MTISLKNFSVFIILFLSGISMYSADLFVDGKLGIGTTTPIAPLDVKGNIISNNSIFAGGYTGSAANINAYSLEVGGDAPTSSNKQATIFFHDWNTKANQFRYTDSVLFWEKAGNGYGSNDPDFIVTGRIGIGTTNLTQKFQLSSDNLGISLQSTQATTYTGILFQGGNSIHHSLQRNSNGMELGANYYNNNGTRVVNSAIPSLVTGMYAGPSSPRFYWWSDIGGDNTWNGTEIMTLSYQGNLGIGISPNYKIHVVGGAYCNGTTWVNGSSRSYKENIKNISTKDAIKTLKKLNPVEFNYKSDKSEKYLGFIAEDVPESVAMNDRKGISSMDVVAITVKVLQEQQKIIEEQNRKIERLENILTKMDSKNNSDSNFIQNLKNKIMELFSATK